MSEPAISATLQDAPWIASQTELLLQQRGHAWLLQGPSGLGQYPLALALARGWLCEAPSTYGACGQCASCHAIDVHTHADLCVLMPETTLMELGWPLGEKAQSEIDDKKRKPSREIRIDALRDAIEFAQRTSARGRGKVLLIYPAERMNHVSANALLKTLEEPAGDTRFVLATEAAHQLLPTLRSRCQTHTLRWPEPAHALAWLQGQGMGAEQAAVWLRASGDRPEDVLRLSNMGWSSKDWAELPRRIARGESALFKEALPVQVIDTLHKLCHDLLASTCGANPRYFEPADLPTGVPLGALSDWSRELSRVSRTAEHPFNAGLMIEDLLSQARAVLSRRP